MTAATTLVTVWSLVLSLVLSTSTASAQPTFMVTADDVEMSTSELEDVTVVRLVPGTVNVAAIALDLVADPSLVRATAAEPLISGGVCTVHADGTIAVVAFDPQGWSEPTELCRVTFAAEGVSGTGLLRVIPGIAGDIDANEVTGVSNDALIIVSDADSGAPADSGTTDEQAGESDKVDETASTGGQAGTDSGTTDDETSSDETSRDGGDGEADEQAPSGDQADAGTDSDTSDEAAAPVEPTGDRADESTPETDDNPADDESETDDDASSGSSDDAESANGRAGRGERTSGDTTDGDTDDASPDDSSGSNDEDRQGPAADQAASVGSAAEDQSPPDATPNESATETAAAPAASTPASSSLIGTLFLGLVAAGSTAGGVLFRRARLALDDFR